MSPNDCGKKYLQSLMRGLGQVSHIDIYLVIRPGKAIAKLAGLAQNATFAMNLAHDFGPPLFTRIRPVGVQSSKFFKGNAEQIDVSPMVGLFELGHRPFTYADAAVVDLPLV